MRRMLAGLLIVLLAAAAGAEPPPPAGDQPAAGKLAQALALLERVDPQTLPADQRQSLYLAVADALLDDGQQERALTFLAKAAQAPPPPAAAAANEAFAARLRRVADPALLAALLQAGTPLAIPIRTELTRRGVALPAVPAEMRTIGVLLPLSGRHAPFGEEVRRGLELARAERPESPAAFVYRDTAAGTPVAQLIAELAAEPGLLGVLGPLTGGDAAAAAAAADREGLPMLLLAPREGRTGGQVFRNALTMAAQAETLAGYASSEGLQRFVIFHPATRTGELWAEQFQAAVESRGGRILTRHSYPAGTINLRDRLQALAASLRGARPEALFIPDDARQVAQIIPQLAFARLDQVQLLGTNAWHDPELGRMAGPSSDGAVFVDGFFAGSPWPEVRDFAARYQAAYGAPATIFAAQGYDAARIVQSLPAGPGDRAALRRGLAALRDFPGVTGLTRFRPDGEAEKRLFLLQIQDGVPVQIN